MGSCRTFSSPVLVAAVALSLPILAFSADMGRRARLTQWSEVVADDDDGDDDDKRKEVELLGEECEATSVEEVDKIMEDAMNKVIGMDKVKKQMQELVTTLKAQELQKGDDGDMAFVDPAAKARKPKQAFAFLGPPGTGKTTIAQILGKIFCALGLVKRTGFLEVRPDQLMGQYVGQTAPKTRKTMAPGLGGVVFIDEAYLITSGGSKPNMYQQECVAAVMAVMDAHARDTVFVFAGYNKDMEHFFDTNAGLKRRVPNIFRFEAFTVDNLVQIMDLKLRSAQATIMPDLSVQSMHYLVAQFTEYAHPNYHDTKKFWAKLNGRPRTAREVPTKFMRYARTLFAHIFRERGAVTDTLVEEYHHQNFIDGQVHLDLETLTEALPQVPQFLDAMVRPLLEQVPEEMRQKSNGGLLDTLLQGAYAARAARILSKDLITDTSCADTDGLRTQTGKNLFSQTCPTLSFFTESDFKEAQVHASASWGDSGEGGQCTSDKDTKEPGQSSPDPKGLLGEAVARLALEISRLSRENTGLFMLQLHIPKDHVIIREVFQDNSVKEAGSGQQEFLRCQALLNWLLKREDYSEKEDVTQFLEGLGADPTKCELGGQLDGGNVRAELMMHPGHEVLRSSIQTFFTEQLQFEAILGPPQPSQTEQFVSKILRTLEHK